jgi:Bacterial Ig-like domain (group 2)/WD40-like Beta Propeller Repeat
MATSRDACLVIVAGLCVGGCGDGGAGPGLARMRIVSGSGQTDTTGVVLERPLVVEVHGPGGDPAEGVTVRFGPALCLPGCALPFSTDLGRAAAEFEVETDARGQASAGIFLGFPAGEAALPIQVSSLELTDTARFHIEPGNPVGLTFQVPDTAVYPGASYKLEAALVDQWLSPRPEPVSYVSETPAIATVSATGTMKAERIGRASVRAMAGGFTEVAHVSVVPEGTVALADFAAPSQVYVVNLDGSGRRFLAETGVLYGGASTWDPDGQTIVYHHSSSLGTHLRRIPSAGGADAPLLSGSLPFGEAAFPEFSADGVWIYFHGYTFSSVGGEIWRVHPDGTALERVGPPGGAESADVFPTPSPDGSRVAFFSSRGHPEMTTLRVLTLADSSETELALDGTQPRWSPLGNWIALLRYDPGVARGAVWVVRPDGTEGHRVSPADVAFNDFGVSWSPDGRWLIAIAGVAPVVLGLDGTALPLRLGISAVYPAWKR